MAIVHQYLIHSGKIPPFLIPLHAPLLPPTYRKRQLDAPHAHSGTQLLTLNVDQFAIALEP